MNIRRSSVILCLLVLPVIALAQVSPSWHDVTVTQRDGWTHENVDLVLEEAEGYLQLIREDGAKLRIPVSDIATIVDARGIDITADVLPATVAAPSDTYTEIGGRKLQETPPAGRTKKAPTPFLVMIGAGLGYGSPAGEFYTGFDSGRLLYGSLRLGIAERTYFKFGYRNQNILKETIPVTDYDGFVVGSADLSTDVRQYLVEFGFLSAENPKSPLRVFAEVGTGWANHVVTLEAGSESESVSEGRLLLNLDLGVLMPLGKGPVGLEAGVFMASKLLGDTAGEQTGFIWGFQGGLTIMFGGTS